MSLTSRTIDRNKIMIHTKPVTLCVAIREETPLKHFVRLKTDAVHKIHRIEGRLFNLCEEILRIAVEFKYTHIM